MHRNSVCCGWKGCDNMFPSIEGMNVHVQMDHMMYRVNLNTEIQSRYRPDYFNENNDIDLKPDVCLLKATPGNSNFPIQKDNNEQDEPEIIFSKNHTSAATVKPTSPSKTCSQMKNEVNEVQKSTSSDLKEEENKKQEKNQATELKYWIFTDKGYLCNGSRCNKKFDTPETAAFHFIFSHADEIDQANAAAFKKMKEEEFQCSSHGCVESFADEEGLHEHHQVKHIVRKRRTFQGIKEVKFEDLIPADPDYVPEKKRTTKRYQHVERSDHTYCKVLPETS